MTQQSLITRLKAVEEAFNLALQEWGPCDCDSCSGARTALSDLRELIKEAEGQEQAGVHAGKPTYTALGEKP